MIKVALTGSTGLVGQRIQELLSDKVSFIPLTQDNLDITDRDAVLKEVSGVEFDIFLHLAAYTNVVGAETNRDLAYRVNRDGTKYLFEAVTEKNRKFIFISTDFVFDGTQPPYTETSVPHPLAVYADSKYQGEKMIDDSGLIVRISYPYRAEFEPKRDFFRTFKQFLEKKNKLIMITDSLMTPTFVDDIAFGLNHLFSHFRPGIIHLVGTESLSPYDAAIKIAKAFRLDSGLIGKISYDEYIKTHARLPRFAHIVSVKNNFYPMKNFDVGLEEIKKQLGV